MRWLLNLTATADLVIVIGSRMRDSNAVRPAQTVALKAMDHDKQLLQGSEESESQVQGLVIINEQFTAMDSVCQLRLWGPSASILMTLCKKLNAPVKSDMRIIKHKWNSNAPRIFRSKEEIKSGAYFGYLPSKYWELIEENKIEEKSDDK